MKGKVAIIFVFVIGLAGVGWLVLPEYLRNALLHGYANIDDYKIFANQKITVGEPNPWPKAEDYNQQTIPPAYLRWLQYYKTTAFVVVREGKLVHESYYNGYSAHSISNSFSMAKSIVSLLVGCAIHDGFLDSLSAPVGRYFTPFDIPQNQPLKIIHLLTMSSGLNWDERYTSPFSLTTQAYYGNDLKRLM
ncbi:MAG: serine hydrolase, partial [Bacteroidales bacterium]